MKKILKGVDSEKQQQHTQLMNEFRKAHRKMFKAVESREEDEVATIVEKLSNNESQVNTMSLLYMYYPTVYGNRTI